MVHLSLHAQKSVLATGEWYKLAITQSGIHKIDVALLRKMGVDPSKISPSQIRIYGSRGGMHSQVNLPEQGSGLIETAIWIPGEEDGRLDNAEAIYFYAEAPHVIEYDSVKAELQHQINYYSDTSYYFLGFERGQGLRVVAAPAVAATNAPVVTQFDDYWYHESDNTNLLKSGREWFGQYLGGAAINIDATIPGVVPSSEVKLRTSAIGAAQVPTKFIWKVNGTVVGEGSIGTVTGGTYDVKGLRSEATYKFGAPAASSFKININYDKGGQGSAQAYLNYIGLQVRRELDFYGKQQTYYFLPQKLDTVKYQFRAAADGWYIWNVTNPLVPRSVNIQNSAGSSSFTTRGARGRNDYIAFKVDQAYDPVDWIRVPNQDIGSSDTPELLIITPREWEGEARRLADFRESNDNLRTLVVTSEQVYNEFASGKPDLTAIRDFARMLYRKTPGRLKYLLLFGDATYDYRNRYKNQSPAQRNNWIPVYESRESLNPVYTYSSDDYYGFLETGEGGWGESTIGDHTMDIGVGRLPVKSAREAETIVDKLIRYESGRALGSWRNSVKFVADDGDGNIHQRHADELAKLIQPKFLPSRIFLDEYPQTTATEGPKAPVINAAIKAGIANGSLILNYTGHGGVSGWAEEQVLTLADMQSARGIDNLPLLFTATCDFGRYDDPGTVSGAEIMVLSPRGAAIGAISTTRPVYSSTNFTISKAFYESLMKPSQGRRMGDFFKETKNNSLVGSLNRNFALLGDPSMKFGPSGKGVRWNLPPDTLRVSQKVKLQAEVYDHATGMRDSLFEGQARITVYDKQTVFKTLGSDGDPESYSEFRSKLFDGSVSVTNGMFTCEFVMPGNIDERFGIGRASVFAVQADSSFYASGQLDMVVGGSTELLADHTPPQVSGYLNSPAFKDGDTVEPSSVLWLKLSDENGINISRGDRSHDITMTLNDTLTIILNDYFVSSLDDYRSGMIRYPFDNLPTGKYIVRVKVWDTHTNSSEIAFGFLVEAARGIAINKLKVFPNPFEKNLSFELEQSRANEDIEIVLNVLSGNGQRLESFRWQYYNSEPTIRESLELTQLGSRISPYRMLLYQVIIRSLKDNTAAQKAGQLVRSP
jgi:hypothetical protein